MTLVILLFLFMALAYGHFFLMIHKATQPKVFLPPPKTKYTFGTKRLTPVLCARHTKSNLRGGKLAIVDSKNCHMCKKGQD